MDIGLGYRDEEHFFTFQSSFLDHYPDDAAGLDELSNLCRSDFFDSFGDINPSTNETFDWNAETEQVLNGDIAVIPVSGNANEVINTLSISPKEEFQKTMGLDSWSTLTDSPDFAPENIHLKADDDSGLEALDLSDIPDSKFSLTSYVCGDDDQLDISSQFQLAPQSSKKVKAGVKKIDMQAQKYIVEDNINNEDDDNDVDIETVSESSPILEATDLNSLLEQFESTSMTTLPQNILECKPDLGLDVKNMTIEPQVLNMYDTDEYIDVKDEVLQINETSVKEEAQSQSICKINKNDNLKARKEPEQRNSKQDNKKPIVKQEVKKVVEKSETLFINSIPQRNMNNPTIVKQEAKKVVEKSETLFINSIPPRNLNDPTVVKQALEKSETVFINSIPQKNVSNSTTSPEPTNKQQILNSLPQELIDRIKESGKRKPITVIPPMPTNNKKRSRVQEDSSRKMIKLGNSDTVSLDHSYCSSPSQQNSKKDSGFESSEDDDKEKREKNIISQQPMVKNADGKLMVSLLKLNTIRNVDAVNNQKKKLNLEEYKKRRKGFLTPNSGLSQNCSPNASSCSSPSLEDEQSKVIKHQEKLRKMAEEVLTAAPKTEKNVEGSSLLKPRATIVNANIIQPLATVLSLPLSTNGSSSASSNSSPNSVSSSSVAGVTSSPVVPHIIKKPPPNIETKVLVSFGVNTDFKISKNSKDPLSTVEQLEEIKPLLQKASSKINNSSLITSLTENISKAIDKSEGDITANVPQNVGNDYEHGENKQVLHLEKDRVRVETKSVSVQTNISLIEQTKRGRVRRRMSSESSSSSSSQTVSSGRSRKSSNSSSVSSRSSRGDRSSSSSSSNYSSRTSTYSRSRSRSPKYSRTRRRRSVDKDHINAVEERRIIYVGCISNSTTKEDLRRKFHKFGQISNISLHFRDHGENYGFVTFKYKADAHNAYEHGNDDTAYPYYKISFGGRREFCKTSYADLDNVRDDEYFAPKPSENSFDALLRVAQETVRKRKA